MAVQLGGAVLHQEAHAGGTTQFIVTWLIAATGHPEAPAWYVAVTSLVAVWAITRLPESRERDMTC